MESDGLGGHLIFVELLREGSKREAFHQDYRIADVPATPLEILAQRRKPRRTSD